MTQLSKRPWSEYNMPAINNTEELKEAIRQLEIKQGEQVAALKDQVHTGFRHIKRASLIKNTFMDMVTSPVVLSTAMDFMTGYRSKKTSTYSRGNGTGNMIKEILSIIVKFGVARLLIPKRQRNSGAAKS